MNKLGCYGVENSLSGDGQKFRERKDSDALTRQYSRINFQPYKSRYTMSIYEQLE